MKWDTKQKTQRRNEEWKRLKASLPKKSSNSEIHAENLKRDQKLSVACLGCLNQSFALPDCIPL